MTKLICGNWKMNGLKADARALASALVGQLGSAAPKCELMVCPPFVHLEAVIAIAAGTRLAVGAQDCHAAASGAHTGDIAASMLKDLGCAAAIVGHSERRTNHGETDAQVKAKATAARAVGLLPIVAIGETLAQRDSGQTLAVLAGQLRGSLPEGSTAANTVVAYEPVWAIGTGRVASVEQVAEAHAAIKAEAVKIMGAGAAGLRILYGGSVTPANAPALLALADVGGALVGGASLKADQFCAIAQSCP